MCLRTPNRSHTDTAQAMCPPSWALMKTCVMAVLMLLTCEAALDESTATADESVNPYIALDRASRQNATGVALYLKLEVKDEIICLVRPSLHSVTVSGCMPNEDYVTWYSRAFDSRHELIRVVVHTQAAVP
jgi:hypothetical protein